jgi:hypothetical protein
MNFGVSVLKAERKFNETVGFTKMDDRLPRFFLEEKLPPSGNVFDVPEEEIDSANKFQCFLREIPWCWRGYCRRLGDDIHEFISPCLDHCE